MEYIPAKTIISGYADNSQWFGMNYNMNIYKGCCHGCIYCDSRSECYHVDNFDTVRAKDKALEIIGSELRRKTRVGVIGTGAMSDPYNPFERELKLTRGALELIERNGFGVGIATKSDLITRDIDVLSAISKNSPVLCKLTVTTFDDELAAKIEPNVSRSSQRFEALKKLAEAGLFSGILLMPVLPFIEDTDKNIRGIIKLAHESDAKFIYPAFGMTLRQNQRDWYYKKLDLIFPNSGLRQKYEKRYGDYYGCTSPRAKQLWKIFAEECERYNILYKMKDIISGYKKGYDDGQISLF